MASSQPRKGEASSLTEVDVLSNLQQGVKEKILTYLPIKEAGRTSILSSKWRYTWSSIPELAFSDFPLNFENQHDKFVKIVDRVFLLHNGPIRKFNLYITEYYGEALDRWIVYLFRNGIKELTLDLSLYNTHNYVINSHFFSCDALNCISLNGCTLRVPLWFNGFKDLHTLELMFVSISANDLEKLISSCPLLKKLKLIEMAKFMVLCIHAPNLVNLEIQGSFSHLQMCAPKLLSLCVVMNCPPESFQLSSDNLARALGNLPNLETLEMHEPFLEYLCAELLLEEFPLTFNHLENINIILDFEEEKEAAFVLALFQRAPHLKSLNIQVCMTEEWPTSPIAIFWERVYRKKGLFKQLQTVNIVDFIGVDSILSFVKFILGSAPQLNTLTIRECWEEEENETMILKQLLRFPRVSPKAEVIFV